MLVKDIKISQKMKNKGLNFIEINFQTSRKPQYNYYCALYKNR